MAKESKNITILGAGITGLALGSFLADKNFDISILEKTSTIGGMAKSFKYKNHTLDFGPHKIYSQIPGIVDKFHEIAGKNNLLKVPKKNSIRLMGKFFDFPVSIPQVILGINPIKSFGLGVGFGLSTVKNIVNKKPSKNYEDYFVSGFGRPAYNLIFKDVAYKIWGNPKTLSEELARKRVPVPNVFDLLKSGSGKDSEGNELSAKHFYYPKKGGVGFICEQLAKNIDKHSGKIHQEIKLERIDVKNNEVKTITYNNKTSENSKNNNNNTVETDFLASTIYLTDLLGLLNPKPPKAVFDAAHGLKYRSLILVYLIINKPKVMKDNWAFFPEKSYVFNRISEHNSFSRNNVEKGKSILTAEITCDFDSEMYKSSDDYLFRRVIEDLEKTGLLMEKDVVEFLVKKAGRVYPVYDIHYRKNINIVLAYLDKIKNLITLGRQGLYNYNNTDHCIDMSLKGADYIDGYFSNTQSMSDWKKTREYFDNYRIVD